jgi:hypothetical protein
VSGKAVVELRDVIHVWIEFRAPKKGELTWAVPADASPEEALEHVIVGRDVWSAGEAGFGYRAFRDVTPEFEIEGMDEDLCDLRVRNIVVHVDYVRSEPALSNVIPHIKLL